MPSRNAVVIPVQLQDAPYHGRRNAGFQRDHLELGGRRNAGTGQGPLRSRGRRNACVGPGHLRSRGRRNARSNRGDIAYVKVSSIILPLIDVSNSIC